MNEKVEKIVIYVAFDPSGGETIHEAFVMYMIGDQVSEIYNMSMFFDETSEESIRDGIFDEETDSRFIDKEKTKLHLMTLEGTENYMEQIFEMINVLDAKGDIEYVIYNESVSHSDFFYDLEEYIQNKDDYFLPVKFCDVFVVDSDIGSLLTKYGLTNHSYSKDSPISCAVYTGILFDIGIGRYHQ